jgi:hypothetical protein
VSPHIPQGAQTRNDAMIEVDQFSFGQRVYVDLHHRQHDPSPDSCHDEDCVGSLAPPM